MTTVSRPDWVGRLSRVQTSLRLHQIEALVVSDLVNIFYLTGLSASAGLLVVSPADVRLIVDGRYELVTRQAIDAGTIAPVVLGRFDRRYDLTMAHVLGSLAPARVGFEAAHVTVATLGAWQRAAADPEWVPTERVVERLREIKDTWEITTLRRGGALIGEVVARLPEFVRAGRTERSIADSIDKAIRDAGFSRPAFDTIVASGPNSAHPHARPGDRILGVGDLVVLDFGGVLDGYCVDLTRMAAVGPISQDAQALFDAVSAAHQAAVDSVRPAIPTWEVDRAARAVLEARGLGDAFLHSTGHGLGLEVHEAPRVGRADPDAPAVVEAGMVFTIEPGAYLEHVGGVRVEDDVLVTQTGAELLTTAPRELLAI